MDKKDQQKINVLDLFSGIGGFALGIEKAGIKHNWLGYSEIDKYANKLYKRRFPNARELGSVTDVSYESLEGQKIDLLTGGFPCQAFSIAGQRRGFEDARGTLFFEIARILKDYIENGKPIPCILLENVKGLLSHDNRRTFTTIYKILADLNYTIECQVVNTRWFLPQNRERIFIFGRYNGSRGGRKVFPIGKDDIKIGFKKINVVSNIAKSGGQRGAVHSKDGIMSCLTATDYKEPKKVLMQIGTIGEDSEATRVYDTSCARTIKNGGGMGAKTGLYNVSKANFKSLNKNQTKKLNKLKVDSSVSGTLTQAISRGGSSAEYLSMLKRNKEITGKIRKLTPLECERLQGFPDNWTEGQSDTQRYKQCGNAVSVPVIECIIRKIYDL
jgi:DNA (cytosine-5)-methyltransferase 1